MISFSTLYVVHHNAPSPAYNLCVTSQWDTTGFSTSDANQALSTVFTFRLWPICNWCICLHPLVVLLPETFKLLSFKISWLRSYMMKVILEMRRLNQIDKYNCLRTSDCSRGLSHRSAQRIPGWYANIMFPIDGGVMLCVMSCHNSESLAIWKRTNDKQWSTKNYSENKRLSISKIPKV